MNLFDLARRLVVEEEGADATEYALLAALIAVAIIASLGTLSGGINKVFNGVGNKLNSTNVA